MNCLQAASSMTNKNPDIFNEDALNLIIEILENYKNYNEEIIYVTLQWLGKACIMHEINRQKIMNTNILEYLKPLLFIKSNKVIKNRM